jgi:GNAT superfamily N-acetyltransferase
MNPNVAVERGTTKTVLQGNSWLRRQGGLRGILLKLVETACAPIVGRRKYLIWERDLRSLEALPSWNGQETFQIIGPHNVNAVLTPRLAAFLTEAGETTELAGVRLKDLLFVAASGPQYLSCGYIFFDTTADTRLHARLYGELPDVPIIGMSYTVPAARGKRLYTQILNHMFHYLADAGFTRVVCEVDPANAASNHASQRAGMRIRREVTDWVFFNRLHVQRVSEDSKTSWRVVRGVPVTA